MKRLNFAEVMEASQPSSTCVSIFLPPASSNAPQVERASQVNSLIKEVKSLLANSGAPISDSLINEVHSQRDRIHDLNTQEAVAWFASEKLGGYMPIQWPRQPLAVVSDSFHIKPLLRHQQRQRPFWILTTTSKKQQLFLREAEGLSLLKALPLGTDETSDVENFRENHPLHRRKVRTEQIKLGRRLVQEIPHSEMPLLVLAGSKPTCSMLAKELEKAGLTIDILPCKPEEMSPPQLLNGALPLAKKHFSRFDDEVLKEVKFCEKSLRALTDLSEIARAAVIGRIEKLVIAEDLHIWGVLDRNTGRIKFHTQQKNGLDEDLLDDLCEAVIQHRGSVWVLPKRKMQDKQVYATLRW
jgi:hypothetical protein